MKGTGKGGNNKNNQERRGRDRYGDIPKNNGHSNAANEEEGCFHLHLHLCLAPSLPANRLSTDV